LILTKEYIWIIGIVNDHQPVSAIILQKGPDELHDVALWIINAWQLRLSGNFVASLLKSGNITSMDPE
jgi:hypothetical protein